VVGIRRKLHNEELHNFSVSQNSISVITSKRMRCKVHVACMEIMRNGYKILVGQSEEINESEDLGVDEGITLEYTLGE